MKAMWISLGSLLLLFGVVLLANRAKRSLARIGEYHSGGCKPPFIDRCVVLIAIVVVLVLPPGILDLVKLSGSGGRGLLIVVLGSVLSLCLLWLMRLFLPPVAGRPLTGALFIVSYGFVAVVSKMPVEIQQLVAGLVTGVCWFFAVNAIRYVFTGAVMDDGDPGQDAATGSS